MAAIYHKNKNILKIIDFQNVFIFIRQLEFIPYGEIHCKIIG